MLLPPIQKKTGNNDTPKVRNKTLLLPIVQTNKIEREKKEPHINFVVTATEKAIMVKFHDMFFGIRYNGVKYDNHSSGVIVAGDMKYVGLVQQILRTKVKELLSYDDFMRKIPHGMETIEFITTNYPFLSLEQIDSKPLHDLYHMCEGYEKIAYELSQKGQHAVSIRTFYIDIADLPPVEKKPRETRYEKIDKLPKKLSDKALTEKLNELNLSDKNYKDAVDYYKKLGKYKPDFGLQLNKV